MCYVLFDIGGTNTRIAASEDLKTFTESVKFKTPSNFDKGIKKIIETIGKITEEHVRGMAGGIRGTLNDDKTEIAHDTKLSDWKEKPFVASLKEAFETEVYLENDAAVVGLGEAHHGAGKGHEIVVYHTISTGVGGAKIEDGEIDAFSEGFEPGLQILDIDKTILGDGIEPTLENLVSGTALEMRTGVKPYEIPQSDAVWDQLAGYLASGLRNSVLYWSPDIIVLGGSMIIGDPRILLDDIRKYTEETLSCVAECPLIVDAELGDEGGLYGAMVLLQQNV